MTVGRSYDRAPTRRTIAAEHQHALHAPEKVRPTPPPAGSSGAARGEEPGADLALYTATSQRSAAEVIKAYSTSFGAASRLLEPKYRVGVTSIYALVRVADEIVDGVAAQAGLSVDAQREALDSLERQTEQAMATGFSSNLVVHAFAYTARRSGIRRDLTVPFFESMRADLNTSRFGAAERGTYIYGSAEVVGLMCLRVFLNESGDVYEPGERARLTEGARRLGAAFQKVNFLRDLGADLDGRGRDYFDLHHALTEQTKAELVADIDEDLAAAAEVIPDLPRGCRAAVSAAHDLFAALNNQLRRTRAEDLMRTRVSVPNRTKARIVAYAITGRVLRAGT